MGSQTSCPYALHGPVGKTTIVKKAFPLSKFDKELLRQSWRKVMRDPLLFGNNIFIRLFDLRPNMVRFFPEFRGDATTLHTATTLVGHPKKVTGLLGEAVASIDDSATFIAKMEALGSKHEEESLQPEYLDIMGESIMFALACSLGEDQWTEDVQKAWALLYGFICTHMCRGLQTAHIDKKLNPNR